MVKLILKIMKSIKLLILLVVVATVSCDEFVETDNDVFAYYHLLYLSIKDASGNDLVKGIGLESWRGETEEEATGGIVMPDLYTLEYIFPNHWQSQSFGHYSRFSFINGKVFKEANPELKHDDYDLLQFYVYTHSVHYGYGIVVKVPFAEKVTFKLKCPYIFGNDTEHEIVTWWKRSEKSSNAALCYRIELGGKEFTKITYSPNEDISCATVIWEDK